MRFVALLLCLACPALLAEDKALSAAQLIAGAKAGKPSGSMVIRGQMEVLAGGKKTGSLNVQIKRRSTGEGKGDQLYRVTYDKSGQMQGAALLLHTTPGGFTGAVFTPAAGIRKLTDADRRLNVFGTDLTIEDILADFLNWTNHKQIGREKLGGNECAIIESRPSGGGTVSHTKSWVEERRYIPWRIEIYDGGDKPVRIEETKRVLRGSSGYWFPREFTISTPARGTTTKIEGSNSDSQSFTDADFSEAVLQAAGGKKD